MQERRKWVVLIDVLNRVECLVDCEYQNALAYARRTWHPRARVIPWLVASDRERAAAGRVAETVIPPNVNQLRKLQHHFQTLRAGAAQ